MLCNEWNTLFQYLKVFDIISFITLLHQLKKGEYLKESSALFTDFCFLRPPSNWNGYLIYCEVQESKISFFSILHQIKHSCMSFPVVGLGSRQTCVDSFRLAFHLEWNTLLLKDSKTYSTSYTSIKLLYCRENRYDIFL